MLPFESWLASRFGKPITRDGGKVNTFLKKLVSGEKVKLTTTKPAFIYIPYRFVTSGLAYVEDTVKIISQYAIVIDGYYSVANVPSMCEIKPESRKRIKILDEEYLEFSFDANSVVIDDLNMFQNSTNVYYIFSEEIAKGNIPLYFNDIDFLLCLDLVGDFANLNLGKNNVALEMIISSITRSAKDLTKYYRSNPDGNFEFIALRNIQLGATNSLSKVMGSNYELGITSSLARDSAQLEDIEELLRL